MRKVTKWIIYTVLIGLLPMLCRAILWLVTEAGTIDFFAVSDLVSFGLVLHISNINEIEHYHSQNPSWKTCHNGISIIFIALYTVIFTVTLLELSTLDTSKLVGGTIAMGGVSLLISLMLYYKIGKSEKNND